MTPTSRKARNSWKWRRILRIFTILGTDVIFSEFLRFLELTSNSRKFPSESRTYESFIRRTYFHRSFFTFPIHLSFSYLLFYHFFLLLPFSQYNKAFFFTIYVNLDIYLSFIVNIAFLKCFFITFLIFLNFQHCTLLVRNAPNVFNVQVHNTLYRVSQRYYLMYLVYFWKY